MQELQRRGAVVFGVSTDSVTSHKNFADKYDLNFPLLSDTEHRVIEDYGAWQEKNAFGKKSMGIVRSTVIIDETGNISMLFPKVEVDGHFAEVLETLK